MIPFRTFFISGLSLLLLTFSSLPLRTAVPSATNVTNSARLPETVSHPILSQGNHETGPSANRTYLDLPVYFEPNLGQTDSRVKFIARGSGVTTFLTATDVVFSLPVTRHSRERGNPVPSSALTSQELITQMSVSGLGGLSRGFGLAAIASSEPPAEFKSSQSTTDNRQSVITMRLVGANSSAQLEGLDRLPGISNYFIGSDPTKWRSNVPHYGKVRYRGIYPGIDLVYYGNPSRLEFDFVVQPGAEPAAIQLSFEGSDMIQDETDGSLVVQRLGAEMSLRKPVIYQSDGRSKREIQGRYAALGKGQVSFEVKDRDMSKLLVIDPEIQYFRILGGQATDLGSAIAVDPTGSIYVTGITNSADFPSTAGAFQAELKPGQCGGVDAYQCFDQFVTKLSPDSKTLVYSTFIGGTGSDTSSIASSSIAVNGAGEVFLAGSTESTDFPVTPGALKTSFAGGICGRLGSGQRPIPCTDAFVLKLNSAGNSLLYSTYLGGAGSEHTTSLAVDAAGHAFVSGGTGSLDFPLASAIQPAPGGMSDGFIAKLNPLGTALIYSTYLGGTGFEIDLKIAVDSAGSAFVTGTTDSTNFPTKNLSDVFVTKVSASQPSVPPTFFVPIVLSASGLNDSRYTTELVLVNRSNKDTTVELVYTAAFGGGSGNASDTLPAGQQRIIPNGIEYLRSRGLAIPDSGNRGGTLFVRFLGLPRYFDAAVLARTMTPIPSGSVGVAYSAVPTLAAFSEPVYLCALRQNAMDRSNVAIQNAGLPGSSDITLRLTVYSGDPSNPQQAVLPDEILRPGEFKQITEVLKSNGLALTNGYIRVERTSGTAPYYAYGVINDQLSSDGSFVPPVAAAVALSSSGAELPAVLETGSFATEVVLTNFSSTRRIYFLRYFADNIQTTDRVIDSTLVLEPGEQRIIPNYLEFLRSIDAPGVQDKSLSYVGKLVVSVAGSTDGIFVGARTLTAGSAGRYGVFYPARPFGNNQSASTGWIYGLQQDSNTRTNLAIATSGVFNVDLFNGDTGQRVSTIENISVGRDGWKQIGSILANYAPGVRQGYARVRAAPGTFTFGFITYAVINDGGAPGERTGDGAFIASSP